MSASFFEHKIVVGFPISYFSQKCCDTQSFWLVLKGTWWSGTKFLFLLLQFTLKESNRVLYWRVLGKYLKFPLETS